MRNPRDLVREFEEAPRLPSGQGERFSGYGVMGLPFTSGNILGLRRFPASSLGPGYTSVWHRDPEGRWAFYQDRPPEQSCPRYFGSALAETRSARIDIDWTGPRAFTVAIDGGSGLYWDVTLSSTTATRALNALAGLLPNALWRSPAVLGLMGGVARVALGAGKLSLAGRVPNGQRFIANPRLLWLIESSRASMDGSDFGPLGPVPSQERLGDFWIPQRGLFIFGSAFFEAFDADRHEPAPRAAA